MRALFAGNLGLNVSGEKKKQEQGPETNPFIFHWVYPLHGSLGKQFRSRCIG